MSEKIQWVDNHIPATDATEAMSLMRVAEAKKVRAFHSSFPQYQPTPLVSLGNLAASHGLKGVYIKDESKRFGLNAFKVLGGSYAMANFIAEKTGRDISELGFVELTSADVREELGGFTFYTATDGNHGRGVAWAANQIGQHSVVYMPKGSAQTRFDNIAKEGAKVTITDMNYDDAVRLAYDESLKDPEHSVALQDTAWPGYEDIPSWIMRGYGTVALEALEQMLAKNAKPTHIIVQAGVGSFAGSFVGFFANYYGKDGPKYIVVEPAKADCHYRSAIKGDGTRVAVTDDMQTIMAGLACGEVNSVSWKILRNHTDYFVSLPEYVAAKGMRVLGSPSPGDTKVVSGESGAPGLGFLMEVLENPEYADLKKELALDENATVLMVSTEGDTDPEQYRRIVWDGDYPTPAGK